MSILFTKMSGSGNDFIIIDNRESLVKNSEKRDLVSKICVPKVSVGADWFEISKANGVEAKASFLDNQKL